MNRFRLLMLAPARIWIALFFAPPLLIVAAEGFTHIVHVHMRLPSGDEVIAEVPRHEAEFPPGETVNVNWSNADETRFPE